MFNFKEIRSQEIVRVAQDVLKDSLTDNLLVPMRDINQEELIAVNRDQVKIQMIAEAKEVCQGGRPKSYSVKLILGATKLAFNLKNNSRKFNQHQYSLSTKI